MGRHGYMESDCMEYWSWIKWRGMVASAFRGKRGQTMLRELLAALDAMSVKELITGAVVDQDGGCCTMGALLVHREVPYLDKLVGQDEYVLEDWNEDIADDLDVAQPLLQEIQWENDEGGYCETSKERWTRMRAWVAKQVN